MSWSSGFSNLSDLLLDGCFKIDCTEKSKERDPCQDAQAYSNLPVGDARKMYLNLQEQSQCLSQPWQMALSLITLFCVLHLYPLPRFRIKSQEIGGVPNHPFGALEWIHRVLFDLLLPLCCVRSIAGPWGSGSVRFTALWRYRGFSEAPALLLLLAGFSRWPGTQTKMNTLILNSASISLKDTKSPWFIVLQLRGGFCYFRFTESADVICSPRQPQLEFWVLIHMQGIHTWSGTLVVELK